MLPYWEQCVSDLLIQAVEKLHGQESCSLQVLRRLLFREVRHFPDSVHLKYLPEAFQTLFPLKNIYLLNHDLHHIHPFYTPFKIDQFSKLFIAFKTCNPKGFASGINHKEKLFVRKNRDTAAFILCINPCFDICHKF